MILWSVCLNSLATTLSGHWPPSPTPVICITAPVLSLGMKNLNLYNWTLKYYFSLFCMITRILYRKHGSSPSCSMISPVFQYWVWPGLWLLCHRWCDQEDQGFWVWNCHPGCGGHPLSGQRNDLQFQNQVRRHWSVNVLSHQI